MTNTLDLVVTIHKGANFITYNDDELIIRIKLSGSLLLCTTTLASSSSFYSNDTKTQESREGS